MPLFRAHAYDDEHNATLVIQAETPDHAGRVARQFVAMMHLGYYPANHAREFPEVVRVEQANSYFDLIIHHPHPAMMARYGRGLACSAAHIRRSVMVSSW